jgi:RES domain
VAFHLTPLPAILYRIGRLPEPFTWRDPVADLVLADEPELEGGRWDAANSEFPTLYCADSPIVAFAEVIAAYRPVAGIEERIAAATEEESEFEPDPPARTGVLPKTFFEPSLNLSPDKQIHARALGEASASDAMLVDVTHPDTHHELNVSLGHILRPFGLDRFDRGVLMTQDRRITRQVASHLYSFGRQSAVGIRFESRLIDGICFALWESATITPGDVTPVTADNEDLKRAADALHIEMPTAAT